MLDDMKNALGTFFSSVWSIFTNCQVPGTNLNFAQIWVGILASGFIIWFIRSIIGINKEEKK